MRQMRFCEERGSGIDKVVSLAEVFQLPAPDFALRSQSFVAALLTPRDFSEMSLDERIRACYQHACLRWVTGRGTTTNGTLRARFGLQPNRAAQITRILKEALERGAIRDADPKNLSRAQSAYLPYWA
jgi:ATP-dependent DNA helicase RecG